MVEFKFGIDCGCVGVYELIVKKEKFLVVCDKAAARYVGGEATGEVPSNDAYLMAVRVKDNIPELLDENGESGAMRFIYSVYPVKQSEAVAIANGFNKAGKIATIHGVTLEQALALRLANGGVVPIVDLNRELKGA